MTAGAAHEISDMPDLIYFSSASGNTHRFVENVGRSSALRLPMMTKDDTPEIVSPYVLLVPTYGGGNDGAALPKQVAKFLNVPGNRALIRGVIGAGNTNFGVAYCKAAVLISAKCAVPLLYKFEIFGTPDDHLAVRDGLETFWKRQ
jgi:protein involved in ribonucleotide reduction